MGNYRRLTGLLIAVLFFFALVLARPFAAHSDNSLFHPAADSPTIDTNAPRNILRGRAMRVNWNALSSDADELRLNLFPDVALTAKLSRVDHSVTGGYVWVGELSGAFEGTVNLSVQDGVLSGSIFRLGREWGVIEYAGDALDGVYWVREIDPHGPEPNGVDNVAPPAQAVAAGAVAASADLSTQGATCRDDGTVIDLMIVYTPQARAAVGGHEAMLALINQRVSEMNSINAVSKATFGWRLVHAMEVNYVETGNIDTDRENLKARGDGLADEIHAARDTYKADLVGMLVSQGTGNTCGTAYRMDSLNYSFEPYSFSVTALNFGPYACSGLTLAHEFGHNLGNAHDRISHTDDPTLYDYSYGYQSPNNTFRTIMAYDCPGGCARIAQWANPDVWYLGEPTGGEYEVDPAQAADIVRSMDNIHVEVANFRASCVPPAATPTNTLVPTSTPTVTPTLTDAPTINDTPTNTSVPTITGTPPTPTRTLRPTATGRPTRTPQATATPVTAATPTLTVSSDVPGRLYLPFILRNR